jgi:hypothetical protein
MPWYAQEGRRAPRFIGTYGIVVLSRGNFCILIYKISNSIIFLILIQLCKISNSREFLSCHEAWQLLSLAISKFSQNLIKYVLLFSTLNLNPNHLRLVENVQVDLSFVVWSEYGNQIISRLQQMAVVLVWHWVTDQNRI